MKVLRVIASVNATGGGPVEGMLRSADALGRLGHQTEVATYDEPTNPNIPSVPFPVHALGPPLVRYGFAPRFVPWLRENAGRFEAVFVHGMWNYTSVATWLALRRSSVPYFVFAHGMLDPWFRRRYPLKHVAKQAFWLALEGKVLRDARAVLFTSEEERRLAAQSFRGHSFNDRVVSYGTADAPPASDAQMEAFRRTVPRLGTRRFLLFLSRIHPKKGCDILLRAFAAIAGEHPALQLVMAGPDQIGWAASELKPMAASLGIADRIHWPGMLSGDEKWGAMRSAYAFVLPSHSENFGIVIAEAMACECPVLTTSKVNIWREVEQAGAGLVGADTVEGMIEVLKRFLALPAENREAMRLRARAAFLEKFVVENAARDLIRVVAENG